MLALVSWLSEAVNLWMAAIVVVIVASVFHYVVASSHQREFDRKIAEQQTKPRRSAG